MPIVTIITTTKKNVLVSVQSYYAETQKEAESLQDSLDSAIEAPKGHEVSINIADSGTAILYQFLNGNIIPDNMGAPK